MQASAIENHDAVELGTGRSRDVSVPMAKEIVGQQIVRAFYTALERGDGEAASLLVIPEKREAGPFSASELSNFYGRLELPFRLIGVYRAGENLYNVTYSLQGKKWSILQWAVVSEDGKSAESGLDRENPKSEQMLNARQRIWCVFKVIGCETKSCPYLLYVNNEQNGTLLERYSTRARVFV